MGHLPCICLIQEWTGEGLPYTDDDRWLKSDIHQNDQDLCKNKSCTCSYIVYQTTWTLKIRFVLQLSYDPTASFEEVAYICWYSEELSSISLNICLLCSVDRIPPISSDCSEMGCTLLDPKRFKIIQFKITSKHTPVLTYKQLTPLSAKKWFC